MEATAQRRRPRCRICEAELPWHRSVVIIYDRVFCSVHARQYHARQRQGVTTEGLAADWSDTLDNWRERPHALDQERGTRGSPFSRMYFKQRVDTWLLFQRSYGQWAWQHPKGFRGADILAIDPQTGGIRRFVSVDTNDVLADLRGIRPAPHQVELGPYWGRRLPPGYTSGWLTHIRMSTDGFRCCRCCKPRHFLSTACPITPLTCASAAWELKAAAFGLLVSISAFPAHATHSTTTQCASVLWKTEATCYGSNGPPIISLEVTI